MNSNSCNNGNVQAYGGANPKSSDEGDSEDDGGLIPDINQDDDILANDDAESSDDDVVDKTVEEMQQVLVKVPAFNPLRTEEARKLRLVPIPTVMKRVNQEAPISSRTRPSAGRFTLSSSRRGIICPRIRTLKFSDGF
jgi:hypothetical protein